MEERHREVIQRNYFHLVQQCNVDSLLPILEQKHVFPKQTIDKYRKMNDTLERKRNLFIDIQSRGPKAFSNLVMSLHETAQYSLANRLDPTFACYVQPKKQSIPFKLPTNPDDSAFNPEEIKELGQSNHSNGINLNTEPLKVQVILSDRFYDENNVIPTYKTHSKKRGFVTIINVIKYENNVRTERKGADVDGRNLIELFQQMGLLVEYYVNLNAEAIMEVVRNLKSSSKLVGCDMAFVIFMGHGNMNEKTSVSEIVGADNNVVSTKWIEEQFSNRECKGFQSKPKILMYQMCRGNLEDYGIVQSTIENDSGINPSSVPRMVLRSCSDVLIAHSTLPGNVSHRDVYLGTWYISLFCEIMMKHAHNTHLEDIFKLIDARLAVFRSGKNTMQTSMYTSIGFKKCYVHPGIYLDGNEIRKINEVTVPEANDIISL